MTLLEQIDAEIEATAARLDALRRARELLGEAAPRPARAPKVAARKSLKPPPNLAEKKRCADCKKSKARSEFNANRTRGDGLQSSCKACQHAYFKNLREGASGKTKKPRAAAKVEEPEPVPAAPVPELVERDVKPAKRSKFRPKSTQPMPRGAYRMVVKGRAAVAAQRHLVRCKIDVSGSPCGAEVMSNRAGLHAWDEHGLAVPAQDALALFEDAGAAA